MNCSERIIVTVLAAITTNNATSEILSRLDFFISVSELIASGRHDKESANYLSPKIRISWTAGSGVKTGKFDRGKTGGGGPKCTVRHTRAQVPLLARATTDRVRFLRTTRGLGNRGTGDPNVAKDDHLWFFRPRLARCDGCGRPMRC